jgi:hypothetical protein
MLKDGKDPNELDGEGWMALWIAMFLGRADVV